MGMCTWTVVLNQTASPFPKRVPGTAGRMCIWPIGPSGVAATRFALRRKKAILSFRQAPCAVDCHKDVRGQLAFGKHPVLSTATRMMVHGQLALSKHNVLSTATRMMVHGQLALSKHNVLSTAARMRARGLLSFSKHQVQHATLTRAHLRICGSIFTCSFEDRETQFFGKRLKEKDC